MGGAFVGALVVAIIAFLYSRRARGGPTVPPVTPEPSLPPPPDEIPPLPADEAQRLFNQAQGSGDPNTISSIADTLFAQGYTNLAQACEAALNAYSRGLSCTSASCINTQIEPAINTLGQLGFIGLLGQLSVHQSLVVARGQ